MAATLASASLAAIRARIIAAPSLGVNISDHLRGVAPQQRRHMGVGVWRERSVNREDEARQQDEARVDDFVIVELAYRVNPKAQTVSGTAALDLEDEIIQRVADCDEPTLARLRPVYLDTVERHAGDWVILTQRYRLTRQQQLGGT